MSHFRSSSPKGERKPFSEEVNSNVDLEATLSMDEKNAYKALIEGCGGGAKSSMENDCGNSYNDDEAKYEIDELKVCSILGTRIICLLFRSLSLEYIQKMSEIRTSL